MKNTKKPTKKNDGVNEYNRLRKRCKAVGVFYYGYHAWDDADENSTNDIDDDLLCRVIDGVSDSETYTREDYKIMLYNTLEILRESSESHWDKLIRYENDFEEARDTIEDIDIALENLKKVLEER